ncbi:MAG TPA: MFS transporter [Vicinamibacteria bacterium]|nr:MFS transporter [Vicinamibacteria bacterium]
MTATVPPPTAAPPLFSARFFLMCGFTFTVFLSAFQLLPTAPYHILALGGSKLAAGLFLGFLTYSSAFSAPLTGGLADRVGKRRMLIVGSLAIAVLSSVYAVLRDYRILLGLVLFHGVFWSGLLSASAAYITDIVPAHRRAEGISYWSLSNILAIAVAPQVGFAMFARGWGWVCGGAAALNLAMAVIAWRLPPDVRHPRGAHFEHGPLVEWHVLILSLTLFLYSFGYGGITSFVALYADANGVVPKSIFFTAFALTILVTRPISGPLSDRIGHRRVFLPCLLLIVVGLALLALDGSRRGLIGAAIVFGTGLGSAYPAYVAHVMHHVEDARRGAAFGGILAAFDTGIGTGSVVTGWIAERAGLPTAYAVAAVLAMFALPFFLLTEKRLLRPLRTSIVPVIG